MSERYEFPFGVYDTKKCCLVHIGLYTNEADCWQIFLGWPGSEEIADAKSRGLKVLPLTIQYDYSSSERSEAALPKPIEKMG